MFVGKVLEYVPDIYILFSFCMHWSIYVMVGGQSVFMWWLGPNQYLCDGWWPVSINVMVGGQSVLMWGKGVFYVENLQKGLFSSLNRERDC